MTQSDVTDLIFAKLFEARFFWPDVALPSDIDVKFRRRGQTVGTAERDPKGRFSVSLTLEAIERWPEIVEHEIIPHEIAHIVTMVQHPRARSHGPEWRAACLALGGNGKATHSLATTPARRSEKFLYKTASGHEYWMGKVRHQRSQRGAEYLWRGETLSFTGRKKVA